MEVDVGVTNVSGTLRGAYGDSGSDSGISSLKSAGSGDERSGSRSSALSVEEASPQANVPARVWHVQSLQHSSLLMAHTQPPTTLGSNQTNLPGLVGYQLPANHPAHHHSMPPEMLWRTPRYPPLPHPSLIPNSQHSPDDLLDRERHDKIIRERREAEVREMEKREREREREAKMERERMEKQRAAEQAVHKHFEESLRLAQQKRNMQSASMAWNNFLSLPPPGSRTHPSAHTSLAAAAVHGGHHHAGPPTSAPAAHPITVAQQQHRDRADERERDAAREREHLAAAERLHRQATDPRDHLHQRSSNFYASSVPPSSQQVSRASSVPGKVEYPAPPAAHSRVSKSSLAVSSLHEKGPSLVVAAPHSGLPKAEPNVSLFGYSSYQQPSYMHDVKMKSEMQQSHKPMSACKPDHHRDHLADHKSSVIVKNEGREMPKSANPPQHSSSPKMMPYLNVQSVAQHKSPAFEYRSSSQSPHHHHHHHLDAGLASLPSKSVGQSYRSSGTSGTSGSAQLAGGGHPHSRASAHTPEPRYLRSEPGMGAYAGAKPAYPSAYQQHGHPQQLPVASSASASPSSAGAHYSTPPPAASKPKVSSPAPSHIYGKPNSGIMTGTPVCRPTTEPGPVPSPIPLTSKAATSPYQQVPLHHGAPPPAHSSNSSRSVYERGYAGTIPAKLPTLHVTGPANSATAPLSRPMMQPAHHASAPVTSLPSAGSGTVNSAVNFQTQPLDLGVERSGSPKRKQPTPTPAPSPVPKDDTGQPVSLEVCKKRRIEEKPMSLLTVAHGPQPVIFSKVTEPSPLVASAATSITTLVNTAVITQTNSHTPVTSISPAPRTTSADGSVRPASTGSVSSQSNNLTVSATASPAPSPAPSLPGTPAKCTTGATQPGADSEKSNSPAPRPPSSTSYPVTKLKKAWLQRHSGEDAMDDTSNSSLSVANVTSSPATSVTTQVVTTTTNSSTKESTGTTQLNMPSAVNSIHNIGSMAVNSIGKGKVAVKNVRKKEAKETNATAVNGHVAEKKNVQEDSSSSDVERKSPPKRKPPKAKRKKGATRRQQQTTTVVTEDIRRRKEKEKNVAEVAGGSESSNESEVGSGSDTSEQISSAQTQSRPRQALNSNNSNGGNKEPRKRGRRPKSKVGDATAEEQPASKKKKRKDEAKTNNAPSGESAKSDSESEKFNPFIKPCTWMLKQTGDSWLQESSCFDAAPRLFKCRECNWRHHNGNKDPPPNVFCRFYAFRRLRYTKYGTIVSPGFCDPYEDALEDDLKLWMPGKHNKVTVKISKSDKSEKETDKEVMEIETALQLIRQVGDQFCDLYHQEKEAAHDHMTDDGTVAWKRVVTGTREMCDVCMTTLFNYHWACGKCGFVVCIDCYKGRKNGTIKVWGESNRNSDSYSWLLCRSKQIHEPDKLILTQIIAGDSLKRLGEKLHECRAEWGIPQHCDCELVKPTPPNEVLIKAIKAESNTVLNGNFKQEKQENNEDKGTSDKTNGGEDKNSPLNWLADVALKNQDKNESGSDSDSDEEDQEGNFSTLRELLIRPSNKSNGGNGSRSNSPTNCTNSTTNNTNNAASNNGNSTAKSSKKSKLDTLDEVISSFICYETKDTKETKKDSLEDVAKPKELKHFVRRYKWTERGREPLPIRIMTLTESTLLYPDVPHSWLCDGKLLKLNEPNNPNNYRLFQDQWKRGQPVIVSDVTKDLNMDLWHPDSFARDFGDVKNDLINCMTGNLVPNQPMRKFWEGFEHFSKRLKDDKGNPMLLKLKDWPPAEDFAEVLPSRFADLMKVLPLSQYTHRNGNLNLASRLPNCFVKPDLGPKMYNAYGSALYPNKGTTNLHLDVSDAVNVMVYVGIPKDADNDEHIKEALRAIDEAGCDILTRRRVREKGEAPGALWHIYAARDADKIRDLLNAVALERGARLEPHHDPIHDQSCYLDGPLRQRLYREYGVEGYAIVQCLGDAVFVPAGAPHQVRNLHNCIKVAEDFVSPENVSHCFHLTQEFRALSDTHTNHEDKLQIKNIIYHTVKDLITVMNAAKEEITGVQEEDVVKVKGEPT